MKIRINHDTSYTYSSQVSLGIHKLFLFPQCQIYQKILEADLNINPNPVGKRSSIDLVGNTFAQVWFDSLTDRLQIKNDLLIDCQEINPFGFIIEPYFISDFHSSEFYGFRYRDESELVIQSFVHTKFQVGFIGFVNSIRLNSETFLDFLVKITSRIHQEWVHLIREEEDLWAPEKTFLSKNGSCRDLAWMQMNMLGSIGLASRFVSGYAFNPELESGHELHAWLETYLPGAGWVGLDPSLGLLTNHLYVPLAFHADPIKTLPVQGTFSGEATSNLETSVRITVVNS